MDDSRHLACSQSLKPLLGCATKDRVPNFLWTSIVRTHDALGSRVEVLRKVLRLTTILARMPISNARGRAIVANIVSQEKVRHADLCIRFGQCLLLITVFTYSRNL